MRAIMRCAAKDVFGHISAAERREFILKLQAIEVYNEAVHDLLAPSDDSDAASANLKVQDGPAGPVVENLSEHSIESEDHLVKLLKTVEARRQVGAGRACIPHSHGGARHLAHGLTWPHLRMHAAARTYYTVHACAQGHPATR